MSKALVNGINLHYLQKGQGQDVVLIHGITGSLAMWYTNVVPALAENYRVTSYDLRGHGYSDLTPTGYTSAHQASDLYGLLEYLDIERTYLVGHSFGGVLALHFAVLYPERVAGIVILDAGVPVLRHLRALDDWPGWEMWKEKLEAYDIKKEKFTDDAERIIRKSFVIPVQFGLRKGQKRQTKRIERLLDETSVIKEFRDVAGLTEDKLAEIQNPTLAVYGKTSPYWKIGSRLQELLKNCKAYFMKKTGHFYLMQNPDAFIELLNQFLQEPAEYLNTLGKDNQEN